MKTQSRLHGAIALCAALFISACTDSKTQPLTASEAKGLIPPPAQTSNLPFELLIKRFKGQTEFLTPIQNFGRDKLRGGPEEAASPEADSGYSNDRAEQEADVFKLGRPDDKLLYLLNNYRGLQIVSFKNDANKPELLSRVKPTGNYPDEMYFDALRNRLIVLENLYWQSSPTSEAQSRVVVYDVADPTKPKISQTLSIQGRIRDSRLLTDKNGGILYLATAVSPLESWSEQQKPSGFITAIDIGKAELNVVQTHKLHLPAVYGELMNIVNVKNAAGDKYYLLAAQSESGYGGWWDRNSLVEIVDISSPKGEISPVMMVAAKGFIRERSQTMIKDGYLLVTSNFDTTSGDQTIFNIAVEAFELPGAQPEVIDQNEATLRELLLQRGLKGKTGKEYDEAYQRLMNDKENGLKGRFVRQESGTLKKLVADADTFYGDSTGLSAALQDVRYQDGMMYVFWVPANQVDPLDLFDISDIKNQGIKHVQRTYFDGWIEKAIPVTLSGQEFIVGLGWEVVNTNRENRERTPKTMIFKKVTDEDGEIQFKVQTQLMLSTSDVWANFNSPDRFIEVRFTSAGKGEILFPATKYGSNKFASGGQIIEFDINQIVAKNKAAALKEGAFLAGNSGWLRRVFTNDQIDRVNTFSDQALGTFDTKKRDANNTVTAVSILELARNIVAYETLTTIGGEGTGVQILSNNNNWWSNDEQQSTELRLVDRLAADKELNQVHKVESIDGGYVDHVILDGSLLIMTSKYLTVEVDGQKDYQQRYYIYMVKMTNNKSLKISQAEMLADVARNTAQPIEYTGKNLVIVGSGKVIAQTYYSANVVDVSGDQLSLTKLDLSNCPAQATENSSRMLKQLNEDLVLIEKVYVEHMGATALKNFMSKIQLQGSNMTCSTAINIPGEPMMLKADGQLLTDDTYALDVTMEVNESSESVKQERLVIKTQGAMTALQMTGIIASLSDQKEIQKINYWEPGLASYTLVNNKLIKIAGSKEVEQDGFIEPWFEVSRSFGPWNRRDQSVEPHIEILDMVGGAITSETFFFETDLVGDLSLTQIWKNGDGYLALIKSGLEMQALAFNQLNMRPKVVPVVLVDEQGQQTISTQTKVHSGTYFWNDKAHYSPDLKSIEVSTGLGGIVQMFIK